MRAFAFINSSQEPTLNLMNLGLVLFYNLLSLVRLVFLTLNLGERYQCQRFMKA